MNLKFYIADLLNISEDIVLPVVISMGILLFAVILYFWWQFKIKDTERKISILINSLKKSGPNGLAALQHSIDITLDRQLKNLLNETRDNLIEIEGDLGPEFYSLRNYGDIWTVHFKLRTYHSSQTSDS